MTFKFTGSISSKEMSRRSLMVHRTKEAAIAKAKDVGNVAFVRNGRIFTCTRSYVRACLSINKQIEVICDHDTPKE